nr:hypothetical protein TorRG33x02_323630 [Ipomoea batatas]
MRSGGDVGNNGGAAERAVGVGPQPRIDTRDVERVAAFGQQPEILAVTELVKTNGAIRSVHEILAAFVAKNRYFTNHRRRQPDRTDIPDRMVHHRTPASFHKKVFILDAKVAASPPLPAGAIPDNDQIVAEEKEKASKQRHGDYYVRRDAQNMFTQRRRRRRKTVHKFGLIHRKELSVLGGGHRRRILERFRLGVKMEFR